MFSNDVFPHLRSYLAQCQDFIQDFITSLVKELILQDNRRRKVRSVKIKLTMLLKRSSDFSQEEMRTELLTSPVPHPSVLRSFSSHKQFYYGIKMAVSKSWVSLHSIPMTHPNDITKSQKGSLSTKHKD